MAASLTILDTQLVQSTLVACGTLLVYDLVCTLDQEVAYVWSQPWSLGTILFVLNRYLPFADTFLSLRLKFTRNAPETCQRLFQVVTWFIVAGIITSESILVFRTYALWERQRNIIIILGCTILATFIPAIVITQVMLSSLRYVENQFPGCRVGYANPIIIVAYILLMLSETVMAILTAIKAVRHLRFTQSPWVVQLYRDGLLFYVYLLMISIANVLVPILAPRVFSNWLATPQRVLHSVLCTRVLLLILKQRLASNVTARRPLRSSEEPVLTEFDDNGTSPNLTFTNHDRYAHTSTVASPMYQEIEMNIRP